MSASLSRWPVALLLFAPLLAGAEPDGEAGPSARELLSEMVSAYDSRTFAGRFLYMYGTRVSTLELKHAVIDGSQYERLTHLDGRHAEVIRAGDKAVCVHPDRSVTVLPSTADIGPLNLREKVMRDIPEQYRVRVDGQGRVAGRKAWRVSLAPQDEHRHGYLLWLDRESGLLLKSEMINDQRAPLERVEFITLDLSPALEVDDFSLPDRVSESALSAPALAEDGPRITAGWLPAGFVVAARDSRAARDRSGALNSLTFSDGLAAFTVFVESEVAVPSEAGISRSGPTVAVTRALRYEARDYAATLVGEIPEDTAQRVLSEVSLEAADD